MNCSYFRVIKTMQGICSTAVVGNLSTAWYFLFMWIGSPSVPVNPILMTSLCPSNGTVNWYTRTHCCEWELWADSRSSRDLNGVNGHSRKHASERVHVKWFLAIHSFSRPVCSCESILLWIKSRCVCTLKLHQETPFRWVNQHFFGLIDESYDFPEWVVEYLLWVNNVRLE